MVNTMIRFLEKFIQNNRDTYYLKLRKKLKNMNPTIITSDCFGGYVYHNLGLKFNSPTINLFFSKEDFIIFVNNLEGFFSKELVEVKESLVNYPVGQLEYNGKIIKINFMHYNTFEEAKMKWDERKKRVDYSNIFIIQLIAEGVTDKDIIEFDKLPYKNKMLVTCRNVTNSNNVFVHKVFNKKGYKPGQILKYKSDFSTKRYMDDINYVDFLNN